MRADTEAMVADYLYPPVGYFWRWEDHGRVVAWQDGRTLAYCDEVAGVIDHLATHGLPPLGALLLMLAACRRDWDANRERIHRLLRGLVAGDRDFSERMAQVQMVLSLLDELQRVPVGRRTAVSQRAALARIVFEGIMGSEADCEAVAASLTAGRPVVERWSQTRVRTRLGADLACLEMALADFSAERAVWRLQTGMDGPPEAAPATASPQQEAVADMVARLAADPELGLVARYARQLSAAAYVPRPVSEPDEQALGGISDVANRGRLDRLLLTELAHEPLVLATRVALGEALYLRHEVPPRAPSTRRLVLLDTGIRTWGVPRVGVVATGLALQEGKDLTTETYVLTGQELVPVNLRTEDGLRQAMAATSPTASPYQAVASWLAARPLPAGDAEVVLVTAAELATGPQLRTALAGAGRARRLVVGVDREALVTGWVLGEFGRRELFRCRLPRSTKPKLRVRRLAAAEDDDLPAIFSRRPMPLRLPYAKAAGCAVWDAERGVVGVTADRRLLWWESVDKGAVQLAENLREREVLALAFAESAVLVVTQASEREAVVLCWYGLDGMKVAEAKLEGTAERVRWARFLLADEQVAVATERRVLAFGLDGAPKRSYPGPGGLADAAGLAWAQEVERGGTGMPGPVPEAAMGQCVRSRRSVMLNLERVAISADGDIYVAGRGHCWELDFDEESDRIRLLRAGPRPPRADWLILAELAVSRRRGYRVLVGGNNAVGVALDQRGMLHLYEIDGGASQVTVVTAQGATAAINQSCDYCGPEFFRFFGQAMTAREVWQQLRELAGRLRK